MSKYKGGADRLGDGGDAHHEGSSGNMFKSNNQIESFLQKNTQKIEQFLTRAEKINRTNFPTTRQDLIIVKAKKDGIGFQEKISKSQLKHLPMQKKEFSKTIKECNKIINKVYCYKRSKDDYDFLKENMKYLKFIFICTTIGFIVLALSEYEKTTNYIFTIGFSILMLSILVTFIVAFTAFFKKRKYINLFKELEIRVKEFLDRKNKEMENSKFRWSIGPELKWLEFHVPKANVN